MATFFSCHKMATFLSRQNGKKNVTLKGCQVSKQCQSMQEPNLSRGPHMSIFVLFNFDLFWVWAENSHFSPPTQLPMHLNYLCLCRLHWSSLPILPIVLFPLLLEGKPFWVELALSPVNLNHLYWHVLKLKYNPNLLVHPKPDLDLEEFICNRLHEVPSLHGDLSDQREGQSRHPGHHWAHRLGQNQWMRSSQWSITNLQESDITSPYIRLES